ncbi:hypothetical protein LUZ60_014702 [Juncus effusus]|nr:hypothetical protein LUZ60_014702 [Juncus effusus]
MNHGGARNAIPDPEEYEQVTPATGPERRWRYRDVAQALRFGLRDLEADFSFLRLRGLRSLLKTLRCMTASESAIRLFRLSQSSRELQVVPVLFENSLRKMKEELSEISLGHLIGVEPIKLNGPGSNSEIALALRALEGSCLLCKGCADLAYRYNAVKVLLNVLLSGGLMEQRACLDALIALLINSSANELDFKECQGINKLADLILDGRKDNSIRIKCAEFLLLITGNAHEKQEADLSSSMYEEIKQALGDKCMIHIQSANCYISSLDLDRRQDALNAQAKCVVELSNRV